MATLVHDDVLDGAPVRRGRPTVVADPEGQVAGLYKDIARQVAIRIAAKAKDFSAKFPTITVSRFSCIGNKIVTSNQLSI